MRPQAKTVARKAFEAWYGKKPFGGHALVDAQWRADREKLWPVWQAAFGAARGNVPTKRQEERPFKHVPMPTTGE